MVMATLRFKPPAHHSSSTDSMMWLPARASQPLPRPRRCPPSVVSSQTRHFFDTTAFVSVTRAPAKGLPKASVRRQSAQCASVLRTICRATRRADAFCVPVPRLQPRASPRPMMTTVRWTSRWTSMGLLSGIRQHRGLHQRTRRGKTRTCCLEHVCHSLHTHELICVDHSCELVMARHALLAI
jgi:hypothetical protein